MGIRKLLVVFLALAVSLPAQQPQAPTGTPLYGVNAKYANGVAPGYWPQAGAGLVLNIGKGTVNCANTMTPYAGGTLTMANNTTNYVYLDTAASCAPASNTSGFTSTKIPIATVVTLSGVITTITDDRTPFTTVASSAGTVASVAQTVPSWLAVAGSPITNTGTLAISPATGQTSHQVIGTCGSATTFTPCALVQGDLPTGTGLRGIPFSIGTPGGTALIVASTTTDYFADVPVSCTIVGYALLIDSGTVTVKFWKVASGTAWPTSGNSISTSGVGVSSGTLIRSSTVTDFTTTAVAAHDSIAMNVTAVSGSVAFVNGVLECQQ